MKKSNKIIISLISIILLVSTVGIVTYYSINSKNSTVHTSSNVLTTTLSVTDNSKLSIKDIDVGSADGELISFDPDTTNQEIHSYDILIDGGNYKSESNKAKEIYSFNYDDKLKNVLDKDVKDHQIETIIATHTHADHIGQIKQTIDDFAFNLTANNDNVNPYLKTTQIFMNKNDQPKKPSLTYTELISEIEAFGLVIYDSVPLASNNYHIIDFVNGTIPWGFLSILAPSNTEDYRNDDPNGNSINNLLIYGDISDSHNQNSQFTMLFTGDSEGKQTNNKDNTQQNDIDQLKKYQPNVINHLDILKAPHHGSVTNDSNNINWLETLNPHYIIVSENNNKLFNGTPTFTKGSYNHFSRALESNGNTLNNLLVTQNIGDVLITIEGLSTIFNEANLTFINRNQQYQNAYLTINKYSTNQLNSKDFAGLRI